MKPDYGSVVGAREDREELQDQDMDLINMEAAGTRGHPETCRTIGPTSTDEGTKLADGSVDSDCPAEWRLEATRDLLGGASLKSA